MSGLVANTDASGEVGRRVAQRLAGHGLEQRLLVQGDATGLDVAGAAVVPIEGYSDPAALQAALAGASSVFLVPLRESPDRVRLHNAAVDAAVAAGVRHIVYLSFLSAAPDAVFTLARHHYDTEQHIRASGVSFTFCRASAFHDVVHWLVGPDDTIRGPAGDGRFASVARDDVADVVAAVLEAPGEHAGLTYDLTGPATVSLYDVAAEFTRASGRPIKYLEETVEQAWAARRALGAPDWQVEAWVSTYLQIATGALDVVTDAVPRLTGRPAQSLSDYLETHPEDLAPPDGG